MSMGKILELILGGCLIGLETIGCRSADYDNQKENARKEEVQKERVADMAGIPDYIRAVIKTEPVLDVDTSEINARFIAEAFEGRDFEIERNIRELKDKYPNNYFVENIGEGVSADYPLKANQQAIDDLTKLLKLQETLVDREGVLETKTLLAQAYYLSRFNVQKEERTERFTKAWEYAFDVFREDREFLESIHIKYARDLKYGDKKGRFDSVLANILADQSGLSEYERLRNKYLLSALTNEIPVKEKIHFSSSDTMELMKLSLISLNLGLSGSDEYLHISALLSKNFYLKGDLESAMKYADKIVVTKPDYEDKLVQALANLKRLQDEAEKIADTNKDGKLSLGEEADMYREMGIKVELKADRPSMNQFKFYIEKHKPTDK